MHVSQNKSDGNAPSKPSWPIFPHLFGILLQMKRRSPIKFVDSRGDFVLCITLEVEAHVSVSSNNRAPHALA